ncbi:glycosyltransferase [Sulfurimonas sp. HSL-1656]|uniref:glycosyltransferase n=1 Tax=Thiomicrolovo subterrani TaxID=3131934 RepID=UPI0031F880B9
MTLLLIGNHGSVFPGEVTRELRDNGISVSHVDFVSLAVERGDGTDATYASLLRNSRLPMKLQSLARIGILAKMLEESSEDIVHFHYARWFYFLLVPVIRRLGKPVAVTVYGSDYYRIPRWKRWLQRRFFHAVDAVTFTNEATMQSLLAEDGTLEAKCSVTRFGLTPLEAIDRYRGTDRERMRQALGVPGFPVTVCCGYNANTGQQHLKMIEALQKLPEPLRRTTLFLFPLTYGGSEPYKQSVISALKASGLHYTVLETFLHGELNAYVRLLPDIMVNMLVSDQLSGSMQEHLYAGNCVIAGTWLPYGVFEQRGVVMARADSFDALPRILAEQIGNLHGCEQYRDGNRRAIAALSRWDEVIGAWKALYAHLLREKR